MPRGGNRRSVRAYHGIAVRCNEGIVPAVKNHHRSVRVTSSLLPHRIASCQRLRRLGSCVLHVIRSKEDQRPRCNAKRVMLLGWSGDIECRAGRGPASCGTRRAAVRGNIAPTTRTWDKVVVSPASRIRSQHGHCRSTWLTDWEERKTEPRLTEPRFFI